MNATYEFAKKYTIERRQAIEGLATLLETKTDLTGPDVIECVKSYGAPKLDSIKDEIQKIVARMKKEARDLRLGDMAAVAALSHPRANARSVTPARAGKSVTPVRKAQAPAPAGKKPVGSRKASAGTVKAPTRAGKAAAGSKRPAK